ncbi:MAG: hypothetical protein HOC91_11405 [Nitrospinaceae bacterium]|mgnify:FL=1|jgi:uncharacterized metal-binding protein YceD (DUF177 family)|nr:hypothetical protein [Nitrospinaceae bacterium]MBT3434484.1 hypothetical protein [Nitrospinaceae bacterium]MBT3821484.1 hypothetical protein [Nitrospinaceae bacterium]MBT4094366.1 hypothetical protein [Nitrospinaceae bacterium]MBT4431113.1 hypothetical protein [Nitrospinaceae bacterium]
MLNDLRYKLDQIPKTGMKIDLVVAVERLNLEDESWPPLSDVKIEGMLERTGEKEAVFEGRVSGSFLVECSLGLAQVKIPVEDELTVYFQPLAPYEIDSGDGVELGERDLEVYYIENDEVDLSSPLRDQLGLAIPIQPKCPDKCMGDEPELCQRLEEGNGVGTDSEIDPRLAALKEWGKVES